MKIPIFFKRPPLRDSVLHAARRSSRTCYTMRGAHSILSAERGQTNEKKYQRRVLRRRNALAITETELKLMAALAIIGLRSQPNNGKKAPAAIGIPRML